MTLISFALGSQATRALESNGLLIYLTCVNGGKKACLLSRRIPKNFCIYLALKEVSHNSPFVDSMYLWCDVIIICANTIVIIRKIFLISGDTYWSILGVQCHDFCNLIYESARKRIYVSVCVYFHVYSYMEIRKEIKKTGKIWTIAGEGYVHCMIFQLIWKISIFQNKNMGKIRSKNIKYFECTH